MPIQKKTEEEILQFIQNKHSLIANASVPREQIKKEFDNFTTKIIPELKTTLSSEINNKNPENVYQLANAVKLSTANAITRKFNTNLGLLWERIAVLAPNVVSPEIEFGYKIEEVDVIVLHDSKLYYTQLKTQKNTLTGSQKKRTVEELKKHENQWFVACIETNCTSTMPTKNLKCLVGKEFWTLIGISYDDILENLKGVIQEVEQLLA